MLFEAAAWTVMLTAYFVLITVLLLTSPPSHAAPPPNADRSMAPWFNSLTDPQTGGSCCGEGDCRNLPVRITDGHFESLVNGQWKTVPPGVVLERSDNPTGDYITCVSPYAASILCFIKRTSF